MTPKYFPRKIFENVNKNYFTKQFSTDNILSQYTIVTQISEERLNRLELLSETYKGPISCSIYKRKFENVTLSLEWLKIVHPKILENVNIHFVEVENYPRYPINLLRNIAWEAVETPYVFILDVDFIPSENIEYEIERFSRSIHFNHIIDNTGVLVVPTFHWNCECDISHHCKLNNFYETCKRGNALLSNHPAQKYTNFTKWNTTKNSYEVQYQILYEPYIIGHVNMTKFDPIFDYGNDKISHMYELAAQKKRIFVLPNAFIGHVKHIKGIHKTANDHDPFATGWYHFSLFELRIKKQYNYNLFCQQSSGEKFIPKCICAREFILDYCRKPENYFSLTTEPSKTRW
eukprot:gene9999-2318_t